MDHMGKNQLFDLEKKVTKGWKRWGKRRENEREREGKEGRNREEIRII